MIFTENTFSKTIDNNDLTFQIQEFHSTISLSGEEIQYSIQETPISLKITQENLNLSVAEQKTELTLNTGIKGDKGDKGDAGEPGSGINAEQIQGISVSTKIPLENQVLIFNGIEWTPSYIEKPYTITLTEEDISRGYTYIDPAIGSEGEKEYIEITPEGGPLQEYKKDYTVMNSDNNQYLVIIWTNSKPIVGILHPVYPSEGMEDVLDAGDKLQIKYNKE